MTNFQGHSLYELPLRAVAQQCQGQPAMGRAISGLIYCGIIWYSFVYVRAGTSIPVNANDQFLYLDHTYLPLDHCLILTPG